DGSDFTGWEINSIGHVSGDGADYTIAILTSGDKTMQDGVDTIQALSGAAWTAISPVGKGQ
ncbi:MAG TPA: hypothetical protein VGM08_01565, partial [Candidatus Saccharimonadales bacterium]